jgi:two-component system, NtrC family, response regulator AtoC
LVLNPESIAVGELHQEEPLVNFMVRGSSTAFGTLQRVIAQVAPTDIPVLMVGESGTGKEVIASEIHRLSSYCKGPFVKFSCSNLNLDCLLGAATEAAGNGIDARQHGTILLDEVNQLDLGKQTLLLSVLPDGQRRVPRRCLASRIISTSTSDLAEHMHSGNFREELYFRLNGICLHLPSLRQRKEDIPPLLAAFLAKYANSLGREQPLISNSTMKFVLQYSWPGNVRELENVARKMVVLGDDVLAISDLAVNPQANEPATSLDHARTNGRSLKQAAREASRKAERQLILESLESTHWNRKRSARELQISYKALLYKLKQLGLDDDGNPGVP